MSHLYAVRRYVSKYSLTYLV